MDFTEGFNGSVLRSFLSKTMDLRAASRASWRWAGVSLSAMVSFDQGTDSGGSNMPRRKRASKRRFTARSTSAGERRRFAKAKGKEAEAGPQLKSVTGLSERAAACSRVRTKPWP